MEHHYVPQCYLRQFLNENKKLVTLNLKLFKERGKFQERFFAEKAICYEEDFYRINAGENSESFFRELNLYTPNYIEEKAFLDFENNFSAEYSSLVNEPVSSP